MRSVPVDRTATLMCLVLKLAKLRLRWSLHPTFSHSIVGQAQKMQRRIAGSHVVITMTVATIKLVIRV
jgi:hypothetical protein